MANLQTGTEEKNNESGALSYGLGNREFANDLRKDGEVEEDIQLYNFQDDAKIEKQGGSVATDVVVSREGHQAKHPGAIPKKRPSKPPQSPDGEKIWAQQTATITIEVVSENINTAHKEVTLLGKMPLQRDFSGLHVPPPVPFHNQQMLSKQAGKTNEKVTLEEKCHSKHPGSPSSLINKQPPIHDSASCQPSKAENVPPGGGLREAVSEEDGVNSSQENILKMGQETNLTATSQSATTMQLPSRCTTLEENDSTWIDDLVRNLKKELLSLKHDLRKKSEELQHATAQATECRSRCAQLEEQMEEECRSRCAQLEEQMEERGIANESYAIRISNLQRRYEELQSHVVEIGIAMADKNETIRILQEECERLRERVPVPIPEDVD